MNEQRIPANKEGANWTGEFRSVHELVPNPLNPRTIKDKKFQELVRSITLSPWMLYLLPIVVDEGNVVLNGNQRRDAAIKAGFTHVPVLLARDLSDAERDELVIKANTHAGEWAPDILAENFNQEQLGSWGLDIAAESGGAKEKKEFEYTPVLKLVIECESEQQQQAYYDQLTKLGIPCKPLTL